MHSLPLFVRLQGRPVILVGEGEAADAKRRILDRAGAVIVSEHADATLAIVALDDDAEAKAVVERLRTRGILVNAVDRPALCDFTLPAIIDRDPILVAFGSGGASAGLAAALRQRFEAMLPTSLGNLASQLFAERAQLKARFPNSRDRRLAIAMALSENGALDPLKPHDASAVTAWLDMPTEGTSRVVIPIRLTSADPDDLTLRTARLLSTADCVCHTIDVPPAILARARADAARVICDTAPEACEHGLCVFLSF